MIKKPEDAVPVRVEGIAGEHDRMHLFTAAEAAQIARAYSHDLRIYRMANDKIETCRYEPQKKRRFIRLAEKALSLVEAWEELFQEWQ